MARAELFPGETEDQARSQPWVGQSSLASRRPLTCGDTEAWARRFRTKKQTSALGRKGALDVQNAGLFPGLEGDL